MQSAAIFFVVRTSARRLPRVQLLTQFKVSPWRDSSGSARVFGYTVYWGI